MKLLAILLLACPVAGAEPAPPATACRPMGAVRFEIDHRGDPGTKLGTSTIKVFATGAWTRDETDADGKAAAQRTGCLAKPELSQLEATLHGAAWKVTMSRMRCMAISPLSTVYFVDGKQVFTQKLCSGANLDDKSRAKLDAAVAQVEAAVGKPAP
jgi:hypothetical protein